MHPDLVPKPERQGAPEKLELSAVEPDGDRLVYRRNVYLRGLGVAIISTSKGVMTDKKARGEHVGGEVLAFIW